MYRNMHWLFAAALATAFAGFYPAYFSRFTEASLLHHVHGLIATAWLCLLLSQSLLVTWGKMRWHRLLGRSSPLLALALLVSASWVLSATVTTALERNPDMFSKLYFADTVFMLPLFTFAYLMGIKYRHTLAIHQRCMVITLAPLLPLALGRAIYFYVLAPNGQPFAMMWHAAMVSGMLLLCLAVADDYRRGHIYWPYPLALAVITLAWLSGFVVPHSPAAHALLRSLSSPM